MAQQAQRSPQTRVEVAIAEKPSCNPWMIAAALVTIAALGAISTGAMGFEGMEPFASFYGHIGSISAMAAGSVGWHAGIIALAISHQNNRPLTLDEVKKLGGLLKEGEYVEVVAEDGSRKAYRFESDNTFFYTERNKALVNRDEVDPNANRVSISTLEARAAKYPSDENASDVIDQLQKYEFVVHLSDANWVRIIATYKNPDYKPGSDCAQYFSDPQSRLDVSYQAVSLEVLQRRKNGRQ